MLPKLARSKQQAFVPFVTTPEEAGKLIADEAQRPSRVIKTRGITVN